MFYFIILLFKILSKYFFGMEQRTQIKKLKTQESVIAVIEPKSITSCIQCSVYSLQPCVLVNWKNTLITV